MVDGTAKPETTAAEAAEESRNVADEVMERQLVGMEQVAAETEEEEASSAEENAAEPEGEGAEKEAPEQEGEAESAEESEEESGDEDQFEEGELGEIKPEVQERINKRIGRSTAKRKEAEERAAQAETQAQEAQAEAQSVKRQLDNKLSAEAYRLQLAPEYLDEGETKLLQQDEQLAQSEQWLLNHFDGYTDPETGDEKYSAGVIRSKYAAVQDARRGLSGKAAALREERKSLMLEDMRRGRELRLAEQESGGKKQGAQTQGSKQDAAEKKPGGEEGAQPAKKSGKNAKPPPIPPAEGAAPRRPVSASRTRPRFDAERLTKEGATPDSISDEYEKAFG